MLGHAFRGYYLFVLMVKRSSNDLAEQSATAVGTAQVIDRMVDLKIFAQPIEGRTATRPPLVDREAGRSRVDQLPFVLGRVCV